MTTSPAGRDRYHALLQTLGCVAVIAFHSSAPGSRLGWLAVDLFFVLAGYNMFRGSARNDSWWVFAKKRYVRLLPALVIVWLIACWRSQQPGAVGAKAFLVFSPVYLHNLIPLSLTNWRAGDAVWVPLWFTAVLFQLQLFVWTWRNRVRVQPAWQAVLFAVCMGLVGRVVLWRLETNGGPDLTLDDGTVIFWSPFAHVEAVFFGALLALGKWRLGRFLPAILMALPVYAATAVLLLEFPASSFGFPPTMVRLWGFLWGYPLLAFVFGAVADPTNFVARWIHALRLPRWFDAINARLSQLSFFAYAFHGTMLVVLWHALRIPGADVYDWTPRRLTLLFGLCAFGSFALAFVADGALGLFRRRRETNSRTT